MSTYFTQLVDITVDGIHELLAAYGLGPSVACDSSAPERTRLIMASIGFGGESARGALTVVATGSFWRAYAAPAGVSADAPDALLSDMVGEFSNMAIGRMRASLLRQGVSIHQATPTCTFGAEMTFRDAGAAEVCWRRFTMPAGALYLRIDASLGDAFVIGAASAVGIAPCDDMMIF